MVRRHGRRRPFVCRTFCSQSCKKAGDSPSIADPLKLRILPLVPYTHSLLTPGTELGTRPRSFLRVFTATFR